MKRNFDKEIVWFLETPHSHILRIHITNEMKPYFIGEENNVQMKSIMPIIENSAKNLVQYIRTCKNKNDIDAKDICSRFTCDNVAACAFGVDAKCFVEDNSEFQKLATDFLNPASWQMLIFYVAMIFPTFSKLIKLKLTPKSVEDRLMGIIHSNLKYRRENNVVRNDFLDSMKQISETTPSFTELDIAAHAASFFVDGFETSSIVSRVGIILLIHNMLLGFMITRTVCHNARLN
ncbi:hypothetical protein NQ318_015334 [Aromia moschata]|uniref:Cytochrome P450 n=1 Tax=Aromia moschata TaxID=1265417 RepID=A0AAV8X9N9_9CUCU|nr:hypothetical protein NQ318_015334 [Aromia moschata]